MTAPPFGCAPDDIGHALRDVADVGAGVDGAGGEPSTCQLPFDVEVHGPRQARDLGSDLPLTLRHQALRLPDEHLKGRFQAVGQIGGTRARLRDLRIAGVEKRIDLDGERLDLVGKPGAEPLRAASADSGQPLADRRERTQPHGHLGPGCRHQQRADGGQERRHVRDELRHGKAYLGRIEADGGAHRGSVETHGQGEMALDDVERGATWARRPVASHRSFGRASGARVSSLSQSDRDRNTVAVGSIRTCQ